MDSPSVIYEDKNFLGIYKPAGLLVHRIHLNKSSTEPTLVDWLLDKFPEVSRVGDDPGWRPGIVHRLDKATSGVMIVPRNQEYFSYLKNLFQTGAISKTYIAMVFGEPREKIGVIDKSIGIGAGVKRSVASEKMLKHAITNYEFLESGNIREEKVSLLRVSPRTGRTHQIRVHLSFLGNPVVGDVLYGRKKQPEWVERLMLHAFSIEWSSEDGRRIRIEAELPKEFKI